MPINRYKLVTRHNPVITRFEPYSPLSVGNGGFAFTADVTGLQTFPKPYSEGIPLCTQSQWGWHTTPADTANGFYHIEDLTPEWFETGNRTVGYMTNPSGQEKAFHWLRMNPHRLHLGRIGLRMIKGDGSCVNASDIKRARQTLNLWTGLMESSFYADGTHIKTATCCHPERDAVAFRIESELIASERLSIEIAFPYGSPDKTAADWNNDMKHSTKIRKSAKNHTDLIRLLDQDTYYVGLHYSGNAHVQRTGRNRFTVQANPGKKRLELVCVFSPKPIQKTVPSYEETEKASSKHWNNYWTHGGMIELADSTDSRAYELERRIVLSQYLLAIQCAGVLPPQETGLTMNSWYGKFHLEMHWWHGVHFALWGRPVLFEKSLGWYQSILPQAEKLALSQGYQGARWPKMVSYDGIDSPSPIGPFLIWQQPHPIYYAELLYQILPSEETLIRYREMVFKTAEFMASYAAYDQENDRYVLGPGLIPAQENHRPQDVMNPVFELEYWAFGLRTANLWRERLHLGRVPEWETIEKKLANPPESHGVYLSHENCPDTFTLFNEDHPAMLGALGMLPGTQVDKTIMRKTLKMVLGKWKLEKVWGWDFPLMAMTAARLGFPALAVDMLLHDSPKNEYLDNGHNKQGNRKDLPIYLPGNGGLLTAVAMMAAGWEGYGQKNPGFPKGSSWKVVWEDLHAIL